MNVNNVLSHKQVVNLVRNVGTDITILIEGEAGTGKTAIAYEMAADPLMAAYHHVTPIDCTQLSDGSIWMPDLDRELGVSRELPNERFGINNMNHLGAVDSRPVVVCLDEIAKAKQFVKDMLAPIVYERRIGPHRMPAGSIVFCCTNLSLEGLGDSIQAHLRNRIMIVRMRKPTKAEWIEDFAVPNALDSVLIATVELFPMVFESFTDYQAGGTHAGKRLSADNPYIFDPANGAQTQVVSPRSLHAASKVLKKRAQLSELELEVGLRGTVGAKFAADIMATMRFGDDNPPFQRVLDEPETCPLSKNATAQMVQVFQFITQVADRNEAEAVCTYIARMKNEMQGLFVHTVANSSRVSNFVMAPTYLKLLAANREFYNA
jgi:MoxR-like ATPase